MIAREGHESTWKRVKYGKSDNQFQPDIKTTIRRFKRIEIKIYRQRMSMIDYTYIKKEYNK